MKQTSKKFTLIITSVLFVIVVIGYTFFLQNTQTETVSFSGSHDVTLSVNPENTNVTQVSLLIEGTPQVFGIIPDVYTLHYHSAEFVGGNLYIIRRIGDIDTEAWTEQLWKYETADKGTNLYDGQGLDFRVSPDGNSIAVFVGSSPSTVAILDSQGNEISTLDTERLSLTDEFSLSYLAMTDNAIWLGAKQGIALMKIHTYTFKTNELISWDVSGLEMSGHDYSLNTDVALVVFSDYQFAFDADRERDLESLSNSLFLYDLNGGTKRLLVTSTKRHEFEPTWIDVSTIEFNAIDKEERMQITIE